MLLIARTVNLFEKGTLVDIDAKALTVGRIDQSVNYFVQIHLNTSHLLLKSNLLLLFWNIAAISIVDQSTSFKFSKFETKQVNCLALGLNHGLAFVDLVYQFVVRNGLQHNCFHIVHLKLDLVHSGC